MPGEALHTGKTLHTGEALHIHTGKALCRHLPTFGSSRSWEDIGSHSQGGSINQKGKALEDAETTTLSASCARMGHIHHETGYSWGLSLQVSWTCIQSPSLEDPFLLFVCLSLCVNCMLCVHMCSSAWAHECGSVCPCGVWSMMPRCLPPLFFILSCVETVPLIGPEAHHVG